MWIATVIFFFFELFTNTNSLRVGTSSFRRGNVYEQSSSFVDAEVVSSTKESLSAVKEQLLRLAARTARGEIATEAEKITASQLVEALEMRNSVQNPAQDSRIYGTWELVYSSTYLFRSSPFFMAARAVCKEGDEADRFNWFCKQHREALAFTAIGKVRQIVDAQSLKSEFETTVSAVPGLPVLIKGTIESKADIVEFNSDSWTLFMDKVKIKKNSSNIPLLGDYLNNFDGLDSRAIGSFLETNVQSYKNPKPVFRTYYLDDELRISRDQDDNTFVYLKVN